MLMTILEQDGQVLCILGNGNGQRFHLEDASITGIKAPSHRIDAEGTPKHPPQIFD
jgi:hypothetical protein